MTERERVDRCPSCQQYLATPAEMAAHVCPSNESNFSVDLAKQASDRALAERQKLRPTKEQLFKDSMSACQQLNDFWDGEVDVIVALVPRQTMEIAYCTNVEQPEKLRLVLGAMLRDTTKIGPMRRRFRE